MIPSWQASLLRHSSVLLIGLTFSFSAVGQATIPSDAPAGTTAKCKDNSYYSGATKKGACSHHGGIAQWYGKPGGTSTSGAATTAGGAAAGAAPSSMGAAPKAGAASGAGAAAGAAAPAAAGASPATKGSTSTTKSAAAPGGGPGQVWVNTSSKVYHCQGDRYYGKTKQGEYMTEAQAKAAGARPDHNKACS
jgi:hypothetical protein